MRMFNKMQLVFVLWWVSLTQVAANEASGDFEGVMSAVQKYFDGTSKGTPGLLKDVFIPGTALQFVRDGKIVSWPADEYIKGFAEGVKYERHGRVVSMDITHNAAMVKAEIDMNDNVYVDYLLLLKDQGKWKITHKTFAVR